MDKDVLIEEKSVTELSATKKTESKEENFAVSVLKHYGLFFLVLILLCLGTAIKDAIDGFSFMLSLFYGFCIYLCCVGLIGSIILGLVELIRYRSYFRLKKETAK